MWIIKKFVWENFDYSDRKIKFFDTSLRDWAQTPGVNLTANDKIEIAKKIDSLWIDYIEAWFASASKADFEAIKSIIKQTENAIIVSLARLKEDDILSAYESLKSNIKRSLIHIFIWTSPLHRQYKLKMNKKQILDSISKYTKIASKYFEWKVMFSPEDALRTERDFLFESVYVAIENGANIINIPDTVWFSQPFEIYELFRDLKDEFGKYVEFSTHNHNDLGNAVINTLYALKGWANILQWTLPPLFGERAWNADLVQVIMNIKKRPDYYPFSIDNIKLNKIYQIVKEIENISWKRIPPHYPILWRLVHSHSSWIHQHGVNANRQTYEIISPEEIGMKIEQSFILTNQSWRAWLEETIKKYFWLNLDKWILDKVFWEFKKLTSKQKFVTMQDLSLILKSNWINTSQKFSLRFCEVCVDYNKDFVEAKIVFNNNWKEKFVLAKGVWPVDAIFKAFENYIKETYPSIDLNLLDFQIEALWNSSEAMAKVYIMLDINWQLKEEYGIDKDIVKASVKAFLQVLNRM